MNDYRKEVGYLSRRDPVLRRVMIQIGPCTFSTDKRRAIFEALVRAVAHQQLHGRAAKTILKRFLKLFTAQGRRFPLPEEVVGLSTPKLRAVGFSKAKAKAIKDIAKKSLQGRVPTLRAAAKLSDEEIVQALVPLRGIGRWSVEMILIFTLGRPDVLPVDDFGVREGFRLAYRRRVQPTPKALAKYGTRWSPYRTIASWYLWRVADLHRKIKD